MSAVVATAPVRVCDVGGWTDTWFGAPGQVCHIAVGPGVRVRAALATREPGEPLVRLDASTVGIRHHFDLVAAADGPTGAIRLVAQPTQDVLLEQAVAIVAEQGEIPARTGIDLHITSMVPAGASLGTSAAVLVAVIGALDQLLGAELGNRGAIAEMAHRCETERAGREAGVQDQWASTFGGCGLLAIGAYPQVRHRAVDLAPPVRHALADRLVTVVFGPHDSSAVHGEVIEALVGCGGAAHDRARSSLRSLSTLANQAAALLESGDLEGWGEVLIESTVEQGRLHSGLVGPAHRRAIEIARSHGVAGWKVNGAGGSGGSLTVLARDPGSAADLAHTISQADPAWTMVDLQPAGGLEVGDV